jgi:phosphatidylcholine synthase
MPPSTAAGFAVHLLTASGALWALLALLAAAEGDWALMFLWLGLAMVVDGVDGPLARMLDLGERLPRWSGTVLDLVIDFATYVLIPAFAIARADLLPGVWALVGGGAVALIGAFYFADTRMKTECDSFEGFPGCWNFVAFVAFVLTPPAWFLLASIAVLGALSFLPVHFVHPVRTRRLRPLTLAVTTLWSALALWAVLAGLDPPWAVKLGLAVATVYLVAVGAVLQVTARRA